jgi:HSP20 family protein
MVPTKKSRKTDEDISIDLGVGGLFKGLGDMLDLVSNLVEKAEQTEESSSNQTGEFKIKGLGEKGRGVYGFSVRTGIGGAPQVEHFGNIRTTQDGPEVADIREPLVDLFDETQEILVVAELPGVLEEEIQVEIQDDVLSLQTTGERKYAKEVLLPSTVDPASLQKTYTNGILELRLKKG